MGFLGIIIIIWTIYIVISILSPGTEGTCYTFNSSNLVTHTSQIDMSLCAPTCTLDSSVILSSGNFFKVIMNTNGLYVPPKKYRVIVKVDPRFPGPLTFVASYGSSSYSPNWYSFSNNYPSSTVESVSSLLNYYNTTISTSSGSYAIPVTTGDVISIRQITSTEFYTSMSNVTSDIVPSTNTPVSFSSSSGSSTSGVLLDNCILFATTPSLFSGYASVPDESSSNYSYYITGLYTGIMRGGSATCSSLSSSLCSASNVTDCILTNGEGITIGVNNANLKLTGNSFVNIGTTASPKYVYYMTAPSDGILTFGYGFDITQVISYTNTSYQYFTDLVNSALYLDASSDTNALDFFGQNVLVSSAASPNQFIGGRYLYEIEVGSSSSTEIKQQVSNLEVRYNITPSSGSAASDSVYNVLSGTTSSTTGPLTFSITNSSADLGGNLVFITQTSNNNSQFSNILYFGVILPIKTEILNLSRLLYAQIIGDSTFVLVVNAALTLCVMLYGAGFALGSVSAKAKDMTIFVVKIIIVSTMLSPTSWDFFNTYLFNFFLIATDDLMSVISGQDTTSSNPFGFVDNVLYKYFSQNLWLIIFTYIVWWPVGYLIPAIVLVLGILLFVWSFIEVIVAYLLAFWSMCVLISLAPVFIIFILFSHTEHMFKNFLSVMVGYVLQPVFAMILILFVNQISSDFLSDSIEVCLKSILTLQFHFTEEIPYIGFSIPGATFIGYTPCAPNIEPCQILDIIYLFKITVMFCIINLLMRGILVMSREMADKLSDGGVSSGGVVENVQSISQSQIVAAAGYKSLGLGIHGSEFAGRQTVRSGIAAGHFAYWGVSLAYRGVTRGSSLAYRKASSLNNYMFGSGKSDPS
ncbi:MAG: type IV secretion system protein [Rickettsiaceae bacterium]|nr:type IV secretion system protein [Rickettsiaceae bacterium]